MKGHRIVRSRAILRVMMRTGQQSRQLSSQMPLTGWRPAGCSLSPRSSTTECARLRPVGAQTTCRGFSTEPVFQNSASPEPPSDTIAKPLGETPGGGPAVSSKVKKLTDEILALNMLELSELLKDLKHRLGLTDADLMGPVVGAGAGGGAGAPAAAAAEEKPKEKEAFDLKLVGYDEKSKIKVIKEVRTITGLGLKEAKELVEGVPKIVKKELKKDDAEKLVEKLKEVGAKVELV